MIELDRQLEMSVALNIVRQERIAALEAENKILRQALKKIAKGDYHERDTCYSMISCCSGAEDSSKEALAKTKESKE